MKKINIRHLKFLEEKKKEYEEFYQKHPDSNEEHIKHKTNVLIPQINRAIEKCREGTFAICDDCGEEIPPERIKFVPTAIRCVKCQETFENHGVMEEMTKKQKKQFLLNTLGYYSAITVTSWLGESAPTEEKLYRTALENWKKAVSEIILKLEGEKEKKEFENFTDLEKINDFKNSDFSFIIFFASVGDVFSKRTRSS